MDPQIAGTWGSPAWVEHEYGEPLAALREDGDKLGLRTHAWRWDEDHGTWVADRGDPGWVTHCTNMSFDTFEASFGQPCRVYRGGDRHLSSGLLALLEEWGVQVDLTVERAGVGYELVEPLVDTDGVQLGAALRGVAQQVATVRALADLHDHARSHVLQDRLHDWPESIQRCSLLPARCEAILFLQRRRCQYVGHL